jgi:hypothetical protein
MLRKWEIISLARTLQLCDNGKPFAEKKRFSKIGDRVSHAIANFQNFCCGLTPRQISKEFDKPGANLARLDSPSR